MEYKPANTHFSQEAIDDVTKIGKYLLLNEHLVLLVQIQSPDSSVYQETYENIEEYLIYTMPDKKVIVMFEIDSKKLLEVSEEDQEKKSKSYHFFFDIKQFEKGLHSGNVLIDKIECYGKRMQLSKFPIIDNYTPSLYYHKHKYKKDLGAQFFSFLFGKFFKKKNQTLIAIEIVDASIIGIMQNEKSFYFAMF